MEFPALASVPPFSRLSHRIELRSGEILHGECLKLDQEQLELRTSWTRSLLLPRGAIRSITPGSEGLALIQEGFEKEESSWKWEGKPGFDAALVRSGKRSLLFNLPGQKGVFSPKIKMPSGTIRFWFHLPEGKSSHTARFEIDFSRGDSKTSLQVELMGGSKNYLVSGIEKPGFLGQIPRSPGWHRLQAEWDANRFLVLIDEYVLLSHRLPNPLGSLSEVRLSCAGESKKEAETMHIDDFVLFQPVERKILPRFDGSQDELQRRGRDQLVGQLGEITFEGIAFSQRKVSRIYPWSDLEVISFASAKVDAKTTKGEQVTLFLASEDRERDQLQGVVKAITPEKMELEHALLGRLDLPRAWVRELRPSFFGERHWLVSEVHHLGTESRFDFEQRNPEASQLERKFRLETLPQELSLLIEVSHLPGNGDGPDFAEAFKKGMLQTEVLLNGVVLDSLNRHSAKASADLLRIRIPIKKEQLRMGENRLQIRVGSGTILGRKGDCEVHSVVGEILR